MALSGTYAFSPAAGELIQMAFARIGIRRTALMAEHFTDARNEMNLMQSMWANRGPQLWTVDLVTTALVVGTATYNVDASTVQLLDVFASDGTRDIPVSPLSRTSYAAIAVKTTAGNPYSYWFNRQIAPTITLYPVPKNTGWTLKYYRFRMQQDANLANAGSVDVPQRWFDALVAELAYRMACIYKPELEQIRKAGAMEAWNYAASQDVEDVPLQITPDLGGYYR